jgi:glycerate dehydrogenase
MANKIVVLDGHTLNPGDNPWDEVGKLGDLTVHDILTVDQVVEHAKDADVILTNKTPIPAEVLEQLPNLKFISVLATGYNVVDVDAARSRNIPVSNVPIYGTDSVAQFVVALMLQECHNVGLHQQAVKDGDWAKAGEFCFWHTPLVELAGKTMGIVGFGRIGRRVGELADALGMKVVAYDVYHGDAPAYDGFEWKEVRELFAESDFISLHAPQTADNTEMVNKDLISVMKPSSFLINTARGGLVHEADLAEALNNGKISGAAVDVVSKEPIEESNPLFSAKNCSITPHIAWAALAARMRLMQTTADNIAAFDAGSPINVVN